MPQDDLSKSVDNLNKFVKDLTKTIDELKNITDDREVIKHRKNLEKLLAESNKLIKKSDVTPQNIKDFDKLIASSQMSAATLDRTHKQDQEFQRDFGKLTRKLNATLQTIPDSVKTISQTATARDVGSTASGFVTGPFGQILKDVVADVGSSTKSVLQRFGDRAGSEPKGSFATGITNIPETGNYTLHKGERVVDQGTNEDLKQFLNTIRQVESGGSVGSRENVDQKPFEITLSDVMPGVFDDIINNDNTIAVETRTTIMDLEKKMVERFRILNEVLTGIGSGFWANWLINIDIWIKRFMRHPVLNSIGLAISGLKLLFKPILYPLSKLGDFLFGRKKASDTDRIIEAVNNVQRVLEGREVESTSGAFFKTFRNLTTSLFQGFKAPGQVTQAQRLEQRRSRGERLSSKEISIIEKNIQYITRRSPLFAGSNPGGGLGMNVDILNDIERNTADIRDFQESIINFQEMSWRTQQNQFRLSQDREKKPNFLKGLGDKLKEIFDKSKDSGKGLFGGIFSKFKGLIGAIPAVLGGLLASARLWAPIAGKLLGGIGLALTGGGLIGEHIVSPMIQKIDEIFKTDIWGFLGDTVTRMIAFLEDKIPFFKSTFGTTATEDLVRLDRINGGFFNDQTPNVVRREQTQETGIVDSITQMGSDVVDAVTGLYRRIDGQNTQPQIEPKGGSDDVHINIFNQTN